MRIPITAGVVAVVVLASACGGSGRRESVSRYVEEVNAVEQQLRPPLADMARVYRELSTGRRQLKTLGPRLARSSGALLTLEQRLSHLDPPADARRLHRLVLTLVRAEGDLAAEVELVAAFVPGLEAALRPIGPANRRLRRVLPVARTPEEQAHAFDRYRRTLAASLRHLRALEPPMVLAPLHAAQVGTLTRVRASAAALADALRRRQRAAVPGLIRRFDDAARSGESVSAQQAQIAAVQAYNRRVARVGRLAAEVRRERDRLERALR